jgi:hypothetical protein
MHRSGFRHTASAFIRISCSSLFLISLFTFLFSPFLKTSAQGDLLISPRRIVFEGSKKSQEINLANSGKDTARYLVSFVQIRMNEDGAFDWITTPDPGQNFADRYLRYYPRTVVLAPNEAQTVKLELAGANRLSPGEYRSHIYFRAVPMEKPLGEEQTVKDSAAFSVKLTPIYGITIPVIIRVGKSTAAVTMTDVSFDVVNDTVSRIKFVLNRTGNMSVYGDIKVIHTSSQGITTQVGFVGGLAVYTPGTVRRCQFDLNTPPGLNLHEGLLKVQYVSSINSKAAAMTQAEITLH